MAEGPQGCSPLCLRGHQLRLQEQSCPSLRVPHRAPHSPIPHGWGRGPAPCTSEQSELLQKVPVVPCSSSKQLPLYVRHRCLKSEPVRPHPFQSPPQTSRILSMSTGWLLFAVYEIDLTVRTPWAPCFSIRVVQGWYCSHRVHLFSHASCLQRAVRQCPATRDVQTIPPHSRPPAAPPSSLRQPPRSTWESVLQ